jgi:hypothetical protein
MDRVGLKYLILGKLSNADGARSFRSIAVITHAEDKRLSEGRRSTLFKTPEARWAAANVKF